MKEGIVRQVGYLQRLHKNEWSTEHKMSQLQYFYLSANVSSWSCLISSCVSTNTRHNEVNYFTVAAIIHICNSQLTILLLYCSSQHICNLKKNHENVRFQCTTLNVRLQQLPPYNKLELKQNMASPLLRFQYKNLLTPWSRVLLEKRTVNFVASQEIPRIYGTPKFLTVPTRATRFVN
jgi:hypothetical protein